MPADPVQGYALERQLGEGGAGRVFLARQASTGQLVALKLLHRREAATKADEARRLARFQREVQLCARLHHPHIVRLLDQGQAADGQPYAVFEYVPGETLKDLLARQGGLSAVEAGHVMMQVLDALACAHAEGIVHRDLKPHNIMVTATGTRCHVKLLDFGIAALVGEPYRHHARPEQRHATVAEGMLCSPSYSAPEQLRGEQPGTRTDLYAWGLVFIECLTGQPAIDGSTLAEVYHKQLSALEVPLPAALIGHPLGDLLRRVLRKAPAERAAHADQLLADLQRINLATIDGDLRQAARAAGALPADMPTVPYQAGWAALAYERRQITVLCCSLVLAAEEGAAIELEALEALQRDQLSQCIDIAARFGGHLAGSLGSSLMFYFGYPQASDDDARRCARAALELVDQLRRRRPMLAQQHGLALAISGAIHTGIVLMADGYLPGGVTPNLAQQLERLAEPGVVLVSAPARRLVEHYLEFDDGSRRVLACFGTVLPYFRLTGELREEARAWQHAAPVRPMVGRAAEMAALHRAWGAACRQAGGAIVVTGQAGIGKSCMLAAMRKLAQAGTGAQGVPGVARHCRCLPEHRADALYPFLELLRGHLQLDNAGSAELARARLAAALEQGSIDDAGSMAVLCAWLALPPGDSAAGLEAGLQLSPERQRELMLATMARLILAMGCGQPLLLLIEDIHWIDQTSAELLARLAQAAPRHALLLLASSRELEAVPAAAGAALERIHLAPLTSGQAQELVHTLLHPRTLGAGAMRRICERTDGVPLFIEELVAMLLREDLLRQRGAIWELDARCDGGDIPATLRDLLAARLARLGPARETAQLAAVIGREFEHALLTDVALTDAASVQADLDVLLAAGLVERLRRVQGDSYYFRHALFLDAAYDAVPLPLRAHTHARIARRLAGAAPEQIERDLPQLARHHALAGEFAPAVQFGIRAVRVAVQRAAFHDAAELAERVGGWIAKLPPPERLAPDIDNCALLTQALMAIHGWGNADVRQNVERSLRLIGEGGDARHAVPALWTMAIYHHVAGNRAEVRGLAARLTGLAARARDSGLTVACHTMLGVSSWIDGRYAGAAEAFEHVLAHYDTEAHADHGDVFGVDSRIWSMASLANVRWFAGAVDEQDVFALAGAAVAAAGTLRHIPSLGVALMYQAFVHQYADDRAATRQICERLLGLGDKYGLPAVEGYARVLYCWSVNDLEGAERVVGFLQQLGCMLGATYNGALVADIAAARGQHDAALARLDDCLALAERLGEQYFKPELHLRRAAVRAACAPGRPEPGLVEQDLHAAATAARAYGMGRSLRRAEAALARMRAAAPCVLHEQQ
jgi:TOMM system kinase/cyclase fusion protein